MDEITKSSGCVFNDLNINTPTRCGELKTVAYYRVNRTHLTHIPHKGYDELVTRQNAEAIIAAERVEKEKLEAAWLEAEGIISDLKADNEAKNREIESITKSLIIEEQLNAAKDAQIDEYETGLVQMHQEMSALESDNKRLREALKNLVERFSYYADLARDGVPNIEDWAYTEGSSDIAKARAVLGEVKP